MEDALQLKLSRRGIVAGIAVAPMLPATPMQTKADVELIALGGQFADIVRLLAVCDWKDEELDSCLANIAAAIVNTQATTMEGMMVKARIACWVKSGNLNLKWMPFDDRIFEDQGDYRMAMSIVRDLIRLHDPGLEGRSDAYLPRP
jgi:hypothetical protein